jgi:predicted polyphosphate/ATP-dependent NAD kinase
MQKVDRELDLAVQKHGVITPPKSYEEEFAEAVQKKKQQIAASL